MSDTPDLFDGVDVEAINRRNVAAARAPANAVLRTIRKALRDLDGGQIDVLLKGMRAIDRKVQRERSAVTRAARTETDALYPGIFIELANEIDFTKNSPFMTETDRAWLFDIAKSITDCWIATGFEAERACNSIVYRCSMQDYLGPVIGNWDKWELGEPSQPTHRQWAVEVHMPGEPSRRFRFWAPCLVDPAAIVARSRRLSAEAAP